MRKFHRVGLLLRGALNARNLSTMDKNTMYHLCTHLNISKSKAEHLCLKHPVINKLNETNLKSLIATLHELGYNEEALIERPVLFSMLPVTLKFRHTVLKECGIENITATCLTSYFQVIKNKTIGELKSSGAIPKLVNVENRLASYMSQWPTSLTTLIDADVNQSTLYALRLKVIQRYLELALDMTNDEFYRGLQTYPTIKHRPLEVINRTLSILLTQIKMPSHKIKANLYLVHADPDNLKLIINNFRSIGGIDIREILRKFPKISARNYSTLVEISNILKEYNISNETQTKCFEIYTLSSNTIRERLETANTIPEFNAFLNHPRFLKMIYYKNTAIKRLMQLYTNDKKCMSLNILSGASARYELFEKSQGDRLGKGNDLIFCISQSLGSAYSKNGIRNNIKRHPFWINIPLVHVKFVYQQLCNEFTSNDIYRNCQILLYPWSKIKTTLQLFNGIQKPNQLTCIQDQLDLAKLNNAQKLSLVLYLLEKNHYFTGNGVWAVEKTGSAEIPEKKTLDIKQEVKQL